MAAVAENANLATINLGRGLFGRGGLFRRKDTGPGHQMQEMYQQGISDLGDIPQYQGPEAFQTMDPAQVAHTQVGPVSQADLYGVGKARHDADALYKGYSPVDTRDAAYASMNQNVADAINMAGGRVQDQRRSAERVATSTAPAIENLYAGQLERLATNKANLGAGIQQMGTNVNLANTGALNQANLYQAGLDSKANAQQAGLDQQAALYNTQGQNAFNQTQADRIYNSGQNTYQQGLQNLYGGMAAQQGKLNDRNNALNYLTQGFQQAGRSTDAGWDVFKDVYNMGAGGMGG